MFDYAVKMVMPVNPMMSADIIPRYPCLVSRKVSIRCYRVASQTMMQEMRCVLKECAEMWVIGHNDELVRDVGERMRVVQA